MKCTAECTVSYSGPNPLDDFPEVFTKKIKSNRTPSIMSRSQEKKNSMLMVSFGKHMKRSTLI